MTTLKTLIFAAMTVTASPVLMAEMVNINEADAVTLAENLKGIGEKKAESIVKYRKENGKFKAIEDLNFVKGIGEAIIEKNREDLSIKSGLTRTALNKKVVAHKVAPAAKKDTEEATK